MAGDNIGIPAEGCEPFVIRDYNFTSALADVAHPAMTLPGFGNNPDSGDTADMKLPNGELPVPAMRLWFLRTSVVLACISSRNGSALRVRAFARQNSACLHGKFPTGFEHTVSPLGRMQ
jgi:hypothetical protein